MDSQSRPVGYVPFTLEFADPQAQQRVTAAIYTLARTPLPDRAERARLEAVCAAVWSSVDPRAAVEAALRAQAEADAAPGDAVAKAWALMARCVTDLSPQQTVNRIENAKEILNIARERNVAELVPTAFFMLLGGLAEHGHSSALDAVLGGESRAAPSETENTRRHRAWFRCMRSTLDGQVDAAEILADEAHAVACDEGDADADSVKMGQLAIIRWFQGRYSELEAIVLQGRQVFHGDPIWAVALAWVWLQQGRRSAARGLIDVLPSLERFPRDRNWLAAVSILAVVAVQLDDLPLANAAKTEIEPYADRVATIGLGVTCWGVVARPLALVALANGDDVAAEGYYREAIELCARTGAHVWLAEAQSELAILLSQRASPEAHAEANALASEAVATARALHLHPVQESARQAWSATEFVRQEDVSHGETTPKTQVSIRVLGQFEVVAATGQIARWRSRKARELLKILVARRGRVIERESLMDLLWPGETPDRLSNRLAVALAAVRRALDPERAREPDAYIVVDSGHVRLRLEHVDIDAERFLHTVDTAMAMERTDPRRSRLLEQALEGYRGDPVADDPEAPWAEQLIREVRLAFFSASHTLGESAVQGGDHITRVEMYQSILALDQYDQRAHEGLIDALSELGAHGRAGDARRVYEQTLRELDLSSTEI